MTSKAIPETTTASPEATVAPIISSPPKVEPAEPETPAEPEKPAEPEIPIEPTPQVNLAATTEVKEKAVPKPRQFLSPYPYVSSLISPLASPKTSISGIHDCLKVA